MNKVTESEIYSVFASLVIHAEQIRYSRFNTILVVNSILILAWAVVAGTSHFQGKTLLLISLCSVGFIAGCLWACLGYRSSQYMDDFHKGAYRMEKDFRIKKRYRPFHKSEARRRLTKRKWSGRLTSSMWLVICMPLIFSGIFLLLIVASLSVK
jgi:hypothetical protein